jgi:DNA polymerase III delta prime subunit
MSDKLPTHISEICWCNPSAEAGYKIETAKIKLPSRPLPRITSWLDELLDGGFEVPVHKGGKRQALGILLTGPPGTGKSTFALELAYRWSCLAGTDLPPHIQEITGKRPLQILYATLEATAEEMILNAASYQWRNFTEKTKSIESLADLKEGRVNIISFANMEMREAGAAMEPGKTARPVNWLERIGHTLKTWATDYAGNQPPFSDKTPPRPPDILIMDGLNSIPDEQNRELFYQQYAQLLGSNPLIIIFILDISPTNERSEFWEFASDVVIKLDRQHHHPGDLYYLIRNLEIVKARFQSHAWGKHQLKIFKGYQSDVTGPKNVERAGGKHPKVGERLRSHAYRTEGGIFIFPSIHFLLSGYEHMAPETEDQPVRLDYYKPKIPNLGKILGNGFPIGRCTALIGERGGHKSHLGYVELLHRVVYPDGCRASTDAQDTHGENGDTTLLRRSALVLPESPVVPAESVDSRPPLLTPATPKTGFLHRSQVTPAVASPPILEPTPAAKPLILAGAATSPLPHPVPTTPAAPKKKCCEKALIVSLRDDEGTTRRTMTKILDRWREFDSHVPTVETLEEKGLVEIIYFPPGYITPEEFYHRLLLSLNRLKHGDDSSPGISLLFNSLDKLATRFPMCAKEPIFIPGIIQMLAGEKVTSIFVAASEEGHSDYYGLGSMADVILEFEHRDFPRDEVRAHLTAVLPGNQAIGIYNSESSKRKNQSLRRAVVVTVGRFSGGHSAGAEGILELLDDELARRDLELGQAYASEHLIFIPRNHMQKGEFGFDPRAAVRSGVFLNP